MKKYDLSKIMKRAWELVKKAALSISDALKKAWEEAKEVVEKEVKKDFYYFNSLAEKYCQERTNTYCTVNHWEKGGNDRYYFNICRKNHRTHKTAGYWDEVAQQYVAPVKGVNLEEEA